MTDWECYRRGFKVQIRVSLWPDIIRGSETLNDGGDELEEEWYEHKSKLMEESLGAEHDLVMHAIIPFDVGGGLDLYYYPNGIAGTAIATKELSPRPNEGSSNRVYGSYELVMFTKLPIDLEAAHDPNTPFGKVHKSINAILNAIGQYSGQASLNPMETCEFPEGDETLSGRCLIFDGYACHSDAMVENFGLLAIIEIFRSELEYARTVGSEELIELLKEKGHWPYSDMDRDPVV